MSGDYRPEVGDIVKVELEVEVVHYDGSLTLKGGGTYGHVAMARNPKVEFVKRKAPVLEAGDVVYTEQGAYLIGRDKTSFVATRGEVISGPSGKSLAEVIALSPDHYTIVKHKGNK